MSIAGPKLEEDLNNSFYMEDNPTFGKMLDDLNFWVNWKTSLILICMEDSIIFFYILEIGRGPQFLAKWNMTSNLRKFENDLNFRVNEIRPESLLNGREPQFLTCTASMQEKMRNHVGYNCTLSCHMNC
jgi:hypothetical protein